MRETEGERQRETERERQLIGLTDELSAEVGEEGLQESLKYKHQPLESKA